MNIQNTQEFDLVIKDLFTNNIYNLFLLHGFDIPELQNKKFSLSYFWEGKGKFYSSKLVIIPKTIKIGLSYSLKYKNILLIIQNKLKTPECISPAYGKINRRGTSELRKIFMHNIYEHSDYTRI